MEPNKDWLPDLMRGFQDALIGGVYESIYKLGQPCRDSVMRGQARTCAGAFLDLGTIPRSMMLDDFLLAMRTAGPSRIDIRRDGNVIEWTELHNGECACPLVRREVVRLDPKLCACAAHRVKHLLETVTGAAAEVEVIETVASGARDCRFRITVTTLQARGERPEPVEPR